MSELIEVVDVPQLDAHAFAPLFDAVWPEIAPFAENVDWAFQRNPMGPGPLIAAVDPAHGMLVGARPSMRWPFISASGEALRVCQFTGTSVHPEYRRRGLFRRMNERFLQVAADSGIHAVYNVSVADSRSGYEKQGWRYLPGLRRYLFVPNVLRFGLKVIKMRGRVRGLVRHEINKSSAVELTRNEVATREMTASREQRLRGFHHVDIREPGFLRYRYSRSDRSYGDVTSPGEYWCSFARLRRQSLKEVLIGDLWLREADAGLARQMLGALAEKEKPDLVTIIATKNQPFLGPLRRAGFWPDPKGDLNFGVRPILGDPKELFDPAQWALTSADIDTF